MGWARGKAKGDKGGKYMQENGRLKDQTERTEKLAKMVFKEVSCEDERLTDLSHNHIRDSSGTLY
jgi:hypothetical protein